MTNPAVNLSVNSATGVHVIEVVFEDCRAQLSVESAARFSADLSTVLAFAVRLPQISEGAPATVHDTEHARLALVENRDDRDLTAETEDRPRRVQWHRVSKGSQKYVTEIDRVGKVTVQPDPKTKGWQLRIGNRTVNEAPISTKRDAYGLLQELLEKNGLPV